MISILNISIDQFSRSILLAAKWKCVYQINLEKSFVLSYKTLSDLHFSFLKTSAKALPYHLSIEEQAIWCTLEIVDSQA
jgi:hypothetical protein